MSREHILVILGILIGIAPFVGLPLSWVAVLLPVFGFVIILIGISLVARKRREQKIAYEASLEESHI